MPNQRSPDKVKLEIWILRTTRKQLRKQAVLNHEKYKDHVDYILIREAAKTPLTLEEHEQVLEETRLAAQRIRANRDIRKADRARAKGENK